MSDWASIVDVRALTEEHISEALESRVQVRELLGRLAEVIRPKAGGARALLVFARMASPDCEWLEGGLRVDILEKDGGVVLETFTDIGGGLKERVLPSVRLECPLSELVLAIAADPQLIAPLYATRPSPERLHLSAEQPERGDAPADDDTPTIESAAPAIPEDWDPPPISQLQPGAVPPPIEFDDLEPPPSSIPGSGPHVAAQPPPKALARIALRRQATRPPVVVSEEHVPRRNDDRSE